MKQEYIDRLDEVELELKTFEHCGKLEEAREIFDDSVCGVFTDEEEEAWDESTMIEIRDRQGDIKRSELYELHGNTYVCSTIEGLKQLIEDDMDGTEEYSATIRNEHGDLVVISAHNYKDGIKKITV